MMINCPECGKQVSETAKVCSNCGYPVGKIGKNTTLSTWAAILAFFTITCPIGFLLGIIDVVKNERLRKHTGSWFAIIWGVLAFIVLVIL